MRESADLGSMIVTARTVKGLLAGFEITPGGWVATLAVGAAIAGLNYFIDQEYVDPAIDRYF